MSETLAMAAIITPRNLAVGHDLSGSDSETLSLAGLLELAQPDDLARWRELGFGYSDPRGAPRLRIAIARRHTHVETSDVLCCAGAQEAIACVAAALLEPDDHAIVVLPIYQPSERAVTSICVATGVPLGGEGWKLDLDRVSAAIRPNTKLILANFPNSPTGAALDCDTLDRLVALCRRHGLWLVNDEVYRETDASTAAPAPPSIVDAYERGVSINGLSKGFGLPGLRVGWAACRDSNLLSRALERKNVLSGSLATGSELLAHIALRAELVIVARNRAIGLANVRRLTALAERLPHLFEIGSDRNLAFAFPRYLGQDGADAFASRLASEAGVLVLPSNLWRSPLGPIPTDFLRIGLGHASGAAGLEAIDQHLSMRRAA